MNESVMKASELYDIELPQAPDFDWLGGLGLLGEILGGVVLIWLIWLFLPYVLRPLAYRHQLKQLVKQPNSALFYQWFLEARLCDVWQDAQHKARLNRLLNQACFSNASISLEALRQALAEVETVFSLQNIVKSLKHRSLRWGRSCFQFGLQFLKVWQHKWLHRWQRK